MGDETIQFNERTVVDQELHALACRKFSFGVLGCDAVRTPALLGFVAQAVEAFKRRLRHGKSIETGDAERDNGSEGITSPAMNISRSLQIPAGRSLQAALAVALFCVACSSAPKEPLKPPIGELFPTASGTSLDGREVKLPADLAGQNCILLIGYEQRTQFDIDRWVMGLMQGGVKARILEIPTISGLVPTLISGWIDDGMRKGIPREDWPAVVTVYGGDASNLAAKLGRENPQNALVVAIDATGKITWFHNRGYSPRYVVELGNMLQMR